MDSSYFHSFKEFPMAAISYQLVVILQHPPYFPTLVYFCLVNSADLGRNDFKTHTQNLSILGVFLYHCIVLRWIFAHTGVRIR